MQSVSFKIWTRVAMSISYDDNYYITGTSKNKDNPKRVSWYNAKQSADDNAVMLEVCQIWSTLISPFITTWAWRGSSWYIIIYRSNKTVLNWVQTKDLCSFELSDVELLHNFSVYKQINDLYLNC